MIHRWSDDGGATSDGWAEMWERNSRIQAAIINRVRALCDAADLDAAYNGTGFIAGSALRAALGESDED